MAAKGGFVNDEIALIKGRARAADLTAQLL